jgi:hypothetical protein
VSRLRLILLFGHLALPVGIWFAIRIGRPRFVGIAFYFVCAVLFIDLLLLLGRPSPETVAAGVLDARLPLTSFVVSVAVLALLGSGILFYAIVTATLVLVSLRVVARDEWATAGWVDLGLVCGVSITLLASQVFTVAYYVNTADTINHTTTAIMLHNGGGLSAIAGTRYFSYPAFHILSSTGMSFMRIEPRLVTGVLTVGLFQLALLATFLFFRDWGRSRMVALIGVLLMSINISFLHYGSLAHYQSMSFVLFCAFLALLGRGQWTVRTTAVVAPITMVWVLTHHVTVLMAIALLTLPIGYLAVQGRVWGTEATDRPTVLVFTTVCVLFGAHYAIITHKFREVLVWTFFSSDAAEGIPSSLYLAESIESVELLLAEAIPFFVDSLHYSFLLALACVGVLVVLRTDLFERLTWRLVLLGFLPAAVIYFPNPLWIPLEGLIPFSRWRLMVLPFLLLVPAVGFNHAVRTVGETPLRRVAVVVFTAALVFTTLTSGLTHPGLTDLVGIQKEPQQHLSDEELGAATFVLTHMNEQQRVHARSDLTTYLHQYAWVQDRPYEVEQFTDMRASHADRRLLVGSGLTVISVDALLDEGIYVWLTDLDASGYSGSQKQVGASVHGDEYQWSREEASVVYTNGAVVVQQE